MPDTQIVAFRASDDGQEHVALVVGAFGGKPPLVRLHSECLTGDVFGSLKCDCGPQLQEALRIIGAAGGGVLLYLRQEGRGIGLANKLRAYALQDRGLDTVDANRRLGFADDERDYGHAAAMLRALGIDRVRLLTNNPNKVAGLEGAGIEVVERVAAPHADQPAQCRLSGRQARPQRSFNLGRPTSARHRSCGRHARPRAPRRVASWPSRQCRPAASPITVAPEASAPVTPTSESSRMTLRAMSTPSRSAAKR